TGRVTLAVIWSPGITPLSIRITTRGKSVCGKTDEGMVRADNTPATQRHTVRNRTAFDWRTTKPLKPVAGAGGVVMGGIPNLMEELRAFGSPGLTEAGYR